MLWHGDRRVDYLALEMAAQRVATILRDAHAVLRGDRVALVLPDTPEFAYTYYGILWAGAVAVPLPLRASIDALTAALRRTGARLVIGWHPCAESIEAVSRALELDCLFVEPREFGRLLAGVAPRAPLATVAANDSAVVLDPLATETAPADARELVEFGHGELSFAARGAARRMSLAPGDLITCKRSLTDPSIQSWTLNACVASGAALMLGGDLAGDGVTVVVEGPGRFDRTADPAGAPVAREVRS